MRRILLILASVLMITGCGNKIAVRPIAGGYSQQREPTEEEVKMFRDVTAAEDATFTPLSVSTQVVAGTNYKFRCRYQENDGEGHCWIVIFKPLPGRGAPELISRENE